MKYLKLFELFGEKNIHDICREYYIDNYTINEDGSIDVNENVSLSNFNLNKLPLNFRNIKGYFTCYNNQLTSLEGCPKSVDNHFFCDNNKLSSLEVCPESVGGHFYCNNNKLTSFKGCPKSIGRDLNCSYNKITTFEHLPFSIGGYFICYNNPIEEIWELFRDYSKIEFLNDCDAIREPNTIILDRLNYFLEEIGKKPVTEVKGYKCI